MIWLKENEKRRWQKILNHLFHIEGAFYEVQQLFKDQMEKSDSI